MNELLGKRFGRLTVAGYFDNSTVICNCDCGKTVMVSKYHLTGNSTRSCGCLRRESSSRIGRHTIHDNSKVSHAINAAYGTNFQKLESTKLQKDNTSGATGVSYRANVDKYEAYITFHKHKYHLGLFSSFDDAVFAREDARNKMFAPVIEEKNENFSKKITN